MEILREKRTRDRSRNRSSTPGPTYMNKDQMDEYLADLRSQRIARPTGARPLPSTEREGRESSSTRSASALSHRPSLDSTRPSASNSFKSHRRVESGMSTNSSRSSYSGRVIAQAPPEPESGYSGNEVKPSATYRESGQRWMERQEARSLREALQDMDLRDEAKLHAAAQDEASELVWKHRNPGAPYPNPDDRQKYTQHLVKGAHARSQSGQYQYDAFRASSGAYSEAPRGMEDVNLPGSVAGHSGYSTHGSYRNRSGASRPRVVSGGRRTTLFTNPENEIYQDRTSDESQGTDRRTSGRGPLGLKSRNSLPGQDHSGGYVQAEVQQDAVYDKDDQNPENQVVFKNGMEVRGADIRAATSMRLKDRSPRLPMPTVVTDRPGRPIVSFEKNWRPSDAEQRGGRDDGEQSPAMPPIPSIVVPNEVDQQNEPVITPTINVSEIPTIAVQADTEPSKHEAIRPLPMPNSQRGNVPLGKGFPGKRYLHSSMPQYTLSTRRPAAACSQCSLPIAGRIVSASGQRFHPECFTCFHCGEGLECVAFYPEPDEKRGERLSAGTDAEKEADQLRFYCHLDFHELFSPRCRSCKTPIEGEVVIACGGEWHVGHFFCAECGDPFDSTTPFVEKDGYAWCINCHTNRYSTKCKKCRRPVTDTVISALGAEWHAQCFCCVECGSAIDDGQFFVREDKPQEPICLQCEERRLKA